MMVSFDICEGNPGALTFLIEAYKISPFKAEGSFRRMQDNDITGAKLYMLWNDCCNRETRLALRVMFDYPIEVIKRRINYENGYGIVFEEENSNE